MEKHRGARNEKMEGKDEGGKGSRGDVDQAGGGEPQVLGGMGGIRGVTLSFIFCFIDPLEFVFVLFFVLLCICSFCVFISYENCNKKL